MTSYFSTKKKRLLLMKYLPNCPVKSFLLPPSGLRPCKIHFFYQTMLQNWSQSTEPHCSLKTWKKKKKENCPPLLNICVSTRFVFALLFKYKKYSQQDIESFRISPEINLSSNICDCFLDPTFDGPDGILHSTNIQNFISLKMLDSN